MLALQCNSREEPRRRRVGHGWPRLVVALGGEGGADERGRAEGGRMKHTGPVS